MGGKLTDPVRRSLRLQLGQFCGVHGDDSRGSGSSSSSGTGLAVAGSTKRLRFVPKHDHTSPQSATRGPSVYPILYLNTAIASISPPSSQFTALDMAYFIRVATVEDVVGRCNGIFNIHYSAYCAAGRDLATCSRLGMSSSSTSYHSHPWRYHIRPSTKRNQSP